MTKHHAESNINTLLTRNLPIDSGLRRLFIKPGMQGTQGMFTRFPGNLLQDSGECSYFSITGNAREDSGECY